MSARDEVFDRIRGLYVIADAAGGDPVRHALQVAKAGCRLVQLRAKGWSEDDVLAATLELVRRLRPLGVTVLVNDLPAVAAEADADGVHVGVTDGADDDVRRALGPGRILGRSANGLGDLGGARGADYVAFGPVFPTTNLSRPKDVQGTDALRAVRALVDRPLVAIGGIDATRLPAVRAAGADAWAVISAVADDPRTTVPGLLR